nr:hypothetical protein [Bacteroidota bacterium]
MMIRNFSIAILIAFGAHNIALSQQPVEYTPAIDILNEAQTNLDDENYKLAIKKLVKINENDTAFAWANFKLMVTYAADSNYREAVNCGLKGLKLNSEFQSRYIKNVSNYYSELNMHDSAFYYVDSMVHMYPYNADAYFYKGLAYLNKDERAQGIEMYQKCITMNPVFSPPHRNIGYLCLANKHIIPAVLSLSTYVLLKGEEEGAVPVLASLEKLFKNEYTWKEDTLKPMFKEGNNFEELEQLITSQIALQKNYKSKVDLSYTNVTKPLQLILEKIEYNKDDKGFWMQTYVPFFVEIRKRNMIEPFILSLFSAVDDDKASKEIAKNKSSINAFIKFASDYFNEKRNKMLMKIDGKEVMKDVEFYDNGALKFVGTLQNNKIKGPMKLYYSNNNLRSEGELNSNEEKEGVWKFYYENGNLSEVSAFKNGKAEGKYQQYNDRGVKIEEGTLVNGKIQGRLFFFYDGGAVKQDIEVKDGQRNGMSYDYYSNGNKKTEREFKANEENGKHLTYFYNGRLKDSVYTKAGKYEGKYVLYDIAGRLAGVGQFTNDYRSGNWKWYHRNGKLKEEATYTNGKLEGTVKKYYDNGKLEDESVYANDKLEGINKNYNRDGILLSELSYRKGKARAYKYFDVNGKVLAEDTESKNKINFKGYFENGNLFGEGLVENDLSQGEWKYYFASGAISSKLNYKDNELDGNQTYYYENGKIKKTITYEEGNAEGLVKTFHENGKLHEQYICKEDKIIGPYEAYFSTGILARTRYYLDDEMAGSEVEYNTDGSKSEFTKYYNGEMIGVGYYDTLGNILCETEFKSDSTNFTMYHINGKPKWQSSYRKGLLNGKNVYLFPDGKTSYEGNFVNGVRNGKYKKYFYNGKVKEESEYSYGQQTGPEKNYYFDGQLSSEYSYEDGDAVDGFVWYNVNGKKEYEGQSQDNERDGYFYVYSADGTACVRMLYKMGVLTSYSYMDKDNKYVAEIPLKNESGKVLALFPNGKKSFECEYKNGWFQGKRITYNPSGNVLEEKNYEDDWLQGPYKEYYENGKLRYGADYLNDRKHGLIKYYNEKGILVREENFVFGTQHGLSKWYNATTGALEKTYNFVYDEPFEVTSSAAAPKPAPKPGPKPAPKPGGNIKK